MNRSSIIADLRDRVHAVRITGAATGFDTPLGCPLHTGEVHEWFGLEDRGTGGGWIPPLTVVIGLAMAARAAGVVEHLVWIGRSCWPCPLGMGSGVLGGSSLVDPADDASRLWAIDTALRSAARLGVVADGRGLTLAHTRRLQLAAGAGAGLGLLLRDSGERSVLSAASTRWTVRPCLSSSGRPRWTVVAIRNKHRPATDCRADVEWDDASGLVRASSVLGGGACHASAAG